jgi:hypothetical protein
LLMEYAHSPKIPRALGTYEVHTVGGLTRTLDLMRRSRKMSNSSKGRTREPTVDPIGNTENINALVAS